MKLFLTVTILLLLAGSNYAADWDLDKGSKQIGGYINLRYMSGDLYEYYDHGITVITLSPYFQYFIQPRFSIGGLVYVSKTVQGDDTWNSLSIGPGMTYYFGNSDSKYWPFVGTAFLITADSWGANGNDPFGGEDGTSGSTFQFAGGMMFKLVDHIHLKGQLYYQFNTLGGNHAEKQSGNVIGLNFGISGFVY